MTGFTVEDIAKITKGALFGANGGAAVTGGVISGVTDTTLVPQGGAARAQCAAILMRSA